MGIVVNKGMEARAGPRMELRGGCPKGDQSPIYLFCWKQKQKASEACSAQVTIC